MEEKRETEDRTPLRGTLGREALQGVGGEEASTLPHPIGPEAALRGSREGVPSLGPLEMGASAPGGKFLNCFLFPSCPFAGGALVSALPRRRARPDRLPPQHWVCLVLPQFPHLAESPERLLLRECEQEEEVDKGNWKRRIWGGWGPGPFPSPGRRASPPPPCIELPR